MLAALSIRDIVLIERLDLEFGAGLTVLTGETGAGKSILLDALSLALGARGDAALVRQGAEQGQVTAVFDVPLDHPAAGLLAENGILFEGQIILRRVQGADGRSRAFANDQPVGVQLLRQLAAGLVEIHGQHDDRALVEADAHRSLLDAHGGLGPAAGKVGAAWREWRQAAGLAEMAERRLSAVRAEADYLRAVSDELADLAPQPGEEESLAERRRVMMQAEKIAGDIAEALETVAGGASAMPTLSSLLRRLERKRGSVAGPLDPAIEALARAVNGLAETAAALEVAAHDAAYDPQELERIEERLFAVRAASRKHNVPVDALPALAERMRADLAALDAGEGQLRELQAGVAKAKAAYEAAAEKLSQGRKRAAKALAGGVNAELPALKLERAQFFVEVEEDAPGETGVDRVGFVVRTNPGSRAGPLMKVASGGELARFLLALKVCLAEKASAPTLIFDEIDTAVGGTVSDAIGQRLARLAAKLQVLAVTHAPQVAARAGQHYLIAKEPRGRDRVATDVTRLDAARRREEIARMLAGSTVTDEARAAADRLIVGAA
ncbi:MAG: DNA repair protein RecN [Bauldia sp.]|nr:DNA repair protein RecN [Bauldia sp.]